MVFPQTVLPLKAEIMLDGAWTDITSKVRRDPGITITRGRKDEGSDYDVSRCTLALDNRDGRFSPRNPTGPYYGWLGRNTPIRVGVVGTGKGLYTGQPGGITVGTAYVSTPDAAALDITGDIDIRIDVDFNNLARTGTYELLTKWTESGNQRSYAFAVVSGLPTLFTSTAGTATSIEATATKKLPFGQGRIALRVTMDVNNGAGGNTTTFYTSDSINGTWTQLGSPVVKTGTTSIFSGSSPLYILDGPGIPGFISSQDGYVFAAQVYNGIAGTLVANPDFTAQTIGASSFVDSTGKTFTLNGTTSIAFVNDIRFRGEISAFPVKWDISGTDIWTPVEAAGITRRLNQGAAPLDSTIKRYIRDASNVVAYWPCEDGEDSTSLGSALNGGFPMTVIGSPDYASSTLVPATRPIPTLNGSKWAGRVATYTGTNNFGLRFLINIPTAGLANNTILASVSTSGAIATWNLRYLTAAGGSLAIDTYDREDVAIATSTPSVAFGLNTSIFYLALSAAQNGANTDVSLSGLNYTTATVGGAGPSSVTGLMGRVTGVKINPAGVLTDTQFGHVSVLSAAGGLTISGDYQALTAFNGESAGSRISRLCTENDISFIRDGDVDDTSRLGPQLPDELFTLIKEAATADGGILYEPRRTYALAYRPRKALNNQASTVTANYALGQMVMLEPVEDDQNTINDVTVIRKNGNSYRGIQTTGSMSTSAIGVYSDEVSLSLFQDADTPDQASWRLHLGTVDEARYPNIEFNLANPATNLLAVQLARLNVGNRLSITNPPAWLPSETINQLAQGFTEVLANYEWAITVNCSPASPWEVGQYAAATVSGADQYKYSSDGSLTNASMTTTATSMSVATASGPLWTTDAAQMPIDLMVAGERMSVTAISGTSSPQTFTVVRSVNGVVKTHASGEVVALFRPARYGF